MLFRSDPTNTPATLSKPILEGLLKGKLGFKGLVVSDDIQMKPIRDKYGIEGALVKCIAAGVDVVIVSGGVNEANKYIADGVRSGELSEERLNDAVRKVLTYKQKNIPEQVPSAKKVQKICASKNNLLEIQKTADKSITLLSNKNSLLPLGTIPKGSRVAIIHPTMGRLMMSDNTNFYPFTFKDVFSQYFDDVYEYVIGLEPNETEALGASDWAFMADYVVFCTYNAYKWPKQLEILKACRAYAGSDKLITVALRSPADLAVLPDDLDTVLATWGVSECSLHALARVIRGDVSPSGMLPVGVGDGKVVRGSGLTGWK